MKEIVFSLSLWATLLCWGVVFAPAVVVWRCRTTLALKPKLLLKSGSVVQSNDPDAALEQPFSVFKVLAGSALIGATVLVCINVLIGFLIGLKYKHWLQVTPAVAAEMGMEGDIYETLQNVFHKAPATNDLSTRFMIALTKEQDGNFGDLKIRNMMWNFIQYEEKKNAPNAYSNAFFSTNAATSDAVRDHLKSCFSGWNPRPKEFANCFTSMEYGEHRNQLAGHSRMLQESFRSNPALKTVMASIYEKMGEQLRPLYRVRAVFWGWVQYLTLVFFYFAIFFLAGRRVILERQGTVLDSVRSDQGIGKNEFEGFINENSNPRYADSPLFRAIKARRHQKPIAKLESLKDLSDFEREREISKAFMEWERERAGLTLPGLAPMRAYYQTVAEAVENLTSRASPSEARNRARVLLGGLIERCERRLNNVEYAYIDFAIYAMPSLGFIGTVIGIGQALGSADRVVRAADSAEQADAITAVTSVLGFAFDTTLVALVTTVIVMWVVARLRSEESALLLDVQEEIG